MQRSQDQKQPTPTMESAVKIGLIPDSETDEYRRETRARAKKSDGFLRREATLTNLVIAAVSSRIKNM